jgi:hypothetical protein
VLSNKRLYIYGFAGIAAVVAYYFAREYYNSGYVDAVASNELWGRYLHTNGSAEYKKVDSFWTYGIPMFTQQFLPWSYLILPAIAVLLLTLLPFIC